MLSCISRPLYHDEADSGFGCVLSPIFPTHISCFPRTLFKLLNNVIYKKNFYMKVFLKNHINSFFKKIVNT